MAKRITKEAMYDEFYETALETVPLFAEAFLSEDSNVFEHIFGVKQSNVETTSGEAAARKRLRQSSAWSILNELYDFAFEGIPPSISDDVESLVITSSEVLALLTSENYEPSMEVFDVVSAADGRFALDTGEGVEIKKLALLANVDERTVRNAVSAGEITAEKSMGTVYVDNKSALAWLNKKRGFTPTKYLEGDVAEFSEIRSPVELGLYLRNARKNRDLDLSDGKIIVFSRNISAEDIDQLESGIFRMPLDACDDLADFYHIDRDEFVSKIMELYYEDYLRALDRHNQSLYEKFKKENPGVKIVSPDW